MPDSAPAKQTFHPVAKEEEQAEPSTGEAIASYLAARSELFAIEAREAARHGAGRLVSLAAAALLALAGYLLVLSGLVGWLSHLTGLPWFGIAFLLAMLHVLVAGVMALRLKRPLPPVFPLSRQELQKDTAWLHTLKSPANKR